MIYLFNFLYITAILTLAFLMARGANRYRKDILNNPTPGALMEDAGWCAVVSRTDKTIDWRNTINPVRWLKNSGRLILFRDKLIFVHDNRYLFNIPVDKLDILYLSDFIDINYQKFMYRVSLFPGIPRYLLPFIRPIIYRNWHYAIKSVNGKGIYKYSLFGFGLIDAAPLAFGLVFLIVVINISI